MAKKEVRDLLTEWGLSMDVITSFEEWNKLRFLVGVNASGPEETGLQNGTKSKNSKKSCGSERRWCCSLCDDEDESEAATQWLKHNKEPWAYVLENLSKTANSRFNSIFQDVSGSSVADYLKSWSVLKQPLGYTLLEEDSKMLYPGKDNCLLESWPSFREKLRMLMSQSCLSESYSKHLFRSIGKDRTTEEDDAVILHLIPSLVPPKLRAFLNKKHWKPTLVESRDSFLMHVPNCGDLLPAIERKRTSLANYNLKLQLFVAVLGANLRSIDASYVVIDDVIYKIDTPLKGIDLCFKVFQTINAKYPLESEQACFFIQKAVFGLETKYDKKFLSVSALMSSLNKV